LNFLIDPSGRRIFGILSFKKQEPETVC